MLWPQQFEIITKIAQKKFIEQGRAFTFKDLENDLGIGRGATTHWKKGQRPSTKDLEKIARGLNISPAWLLLGIGEPVPDAEPGEFNPEWVYVCDTLKDFAEGTLRVDPDEFAQAGGLSRQELDACLNSRKLPPATAVGRWVRRYRLNANFLLAQIGEPLLTEAEYWRTGPLTRIFEKLRLDEGLDELEKQEDAAKDQERARRPGRHAATPVARQTSQPTAGAADSLTRQMEALERLLRKANAPDEDIREGLLSLVKAYRPAAYPTAEFEQKPDRYGEAAEDQAPYPDKKLAG